MSILFRIRLFCSTVWVVSSGSALRKVATHDFSLLLGQLVSRKTDVSTLILLGDGVGDVGLVDVLDLLLLGVGPSRLFGLLSSEFRHDRHGEG